MFRPAVKANGASIAKPNLVAMETLSRMSASASPNFSLV
jgi:hypothetical protein